MDLQTVPRVADAYAADQRRENGAAVSAILRLWSRVGEDFDRDFLAVAPQMLEVSNVAQQRVSERAQAYVPEILAATGQARADKPRHRIDSAAFVGVAGDGRPTETLLYGAVTKTKEAVAAGLTPAQALANGGQFLSMAFGTMLSDTSRGMELLETGVRPVAGYVRMLTPPSCGRCVILGGKHYKRNVQFQRHPGCDCRTIPAAESIAGDLTVNADAYLESLPTADQLRAKYPGMSLDDIYRDHRETYLEKVLGSKANAQAWRDYGANSSQLVNAYRKTGGVRPAQIYGRNIKYTTEGTTRRGLAYRQMSRMRAVVNAGEVKDGRYRRLLAPRLMPETIFRIAKDRADADRLLRIYGWI